MWPELRLLALPLRWFVYSFRYKAGLMRCHPGKHGGTWLSLVPANDCSMEYRGIEDD